MTSPTPPQNRRTKSLASFFVTLAAIALMVSTAHAVEISAPADARSTLDDATQERIVADYGNLPLSFEENLGQTDAQVRFLSRGRGYALFLTGTEAVLALRRPAPAEDEATVSDVMRVQLVGSNPRPAVSGLERLPGQSNYLMGDDPAQWRTGIAHYGKVSYREVYPGIDLVYYGTDQRQLEHDFVVAPGADPDQIRFSVAGAESLNLDEMGNLVASTTGGDVIFQAPVTYQDIDGVRRPVESQYVLLVSAGDLAGTRGGEVGGENSIVGFELAAYDPVHPVVIDPVLSYSTYLGIGGNDQGRGIAVDGSGQAYVTGFTSAAGFPTTAPVLDDTHNLSGDVFVTVLDPTGSALVYSTYLGGSGNDNGQNIAVDGSGNAYVAGLTTSSDFPVVNAFQGGFVGGGTDAYVAVLNPTGTALLYSTYLGGTTDDQAEGIAVDGSGNAYVTGFTTSTDFPFTPGAYQTSNNGGQDVFVSKLDPALSGSASLVYSTYLGGTSQDLGLDIAVDGSGNAFVTGNASGSFPTTPSAFDQISNGGNDAFATKLNNTGTAVLYSTFLGGGGNDQGRGIAVDGSGNAYVTGSATGAFPTTPGAFQTTFAGLPGDIDGFVAKLDPALSGSASLVYSTLLGGGVFGDIGLGIAVDASGSAIVFGQTGSSDFPTTASAFQIAHTPGLDNDLFISVLNSAGSALDYSTFLGGTSRDDANEIALDGSGNVYVTGWTLSSDFPTASAFDGSYASGEDVIVAKLAGVGAPPPPSASVKIYAPADFVIPSGQTANVPIFVEDAPSSLDYRGIDLVLRYDSQVVIATGVSTVGTETFGWFEEHKIIDLPGDIDEIRISLASSSALHVTLTPETLVEVIFQAATVTTPTSTALDFPDLDPGTAGIESVQLNEVSLDAADVTDGSIKLSGVDGGVTFDPSPVLPSQTLGITLTDSDEAGSGTLSATVRSETSGGASKESKSVVLTETGSGVFEGSVTTIYGTSGNGATAAFEVEPGDNIDVDYNDAFDSSGNASTSTTTVSVSAGVDGTVATSPATINSGDGVTVTVNDADQSGSVTATVKNLTTGETETVTLNETAPGSGVFTAVLPTVAGASPNDDGTMGTNAADQIGATYDDPVGASGASVAGIFSVTTTDGAFAGLPASLVVAENLNVTLNDLDFDGGASGATRVNGAASLTLTVRNTITGETESLIVTENPAGSGTFEGTIATEYEDGTSITSSDGPLGVKPGDQVEVEYVDALGAGGGSPTITSSSIAIVGGSTATVATSPTTVSIGGGITVTVTDADQSGSVTATVTNLTTGEVETLVLTETGPGTGVFTAVLPTAGGASGDNNGTLGANAGDQIRATYDDPVGAGGAPLPGISSMTSTDGAFSGLPATLKVADDLDVTLTDADFNGAVSGATRVSGAGILTLTVRNTTTGETESLTATENPIGGGVFDGTISTQYDDGTSPSSGDGTLGVKPTDQVEVEYADGLGAGGAPTTITSSTVAIIGGSDGTIVAAPASIEPGDGVDVTVTDGDLAGSGSLNVTVDNTTNGDSESLTLTETATPGTFTATISTVFGTSSNAGDGSIQAQAGDVITAEYTDQVTSGGAPVLRTSNTVSVTGGVLGTLSVSLAVQAGDGLRIELTDADLNTNPATAQTAQVTVTNNTNGDTETITLDETGNNTGVFRVTPPVTTDAAPTPTSENGTLSVVAQDDIETTYNDALNVSGGSETVTATTNGVLWGDNSLNLKVGALDASKILQHVVQIALFVPGSYEELVSDVNPPISENSHLYPQILADDATHVLQFTVGIISVFPIQTGVTNPHPYKRVGEERLLALGQPKVDGRQMLLPVWVDESDGVLSGQLKLDFDPAQYKVIGVANTENTSEYLVASNAAEGQLRIAFAGARSQSAGEAPLLHIRVEALGQVDEKAPLTIAEASLNGGDLQTRAVEDFHSFALPEAYSLLQNWPNPFNPETALRYSLPQAGKVQLTIYDMLGQQVRTLVDGHREAGAHTAHWDGSNATGHPVASGTYFYHIRADGFSKTRKMTLLR